jgi:hypothetical protein
MNVSTCQAPMAFGIPKRCSLMNPPLRNLKALALMLRE